MTFFIQCPLCGKKNSSEVTNCSFCNSILTDHQTLLHASQSPLILDEVDTSSTRIHWKKFSAFLILLIVLACPWYFIREIITTPSEIYNNQQQFHQTFNNYFQKEKSWNEEKNSILKMMDNHYTDKSILKHPMTFEKIPVEILFSYLKENLKFFEENISNVTIFPSSNCSSSQIIITKRQQNLWPLQVTLTLEIAIDNTNRSLTTQFIRLRQGKRDLNPDLAWFYFQPELERLQPLKSFYGGIQQLKIFHNQPQKSSSSTPYFSWKYQHHHI